MKFSLPLAIFAIAASVDAAAVANPEADPWCLIKGQSCWKDKRSAEALPEAEAQPWCLIKGQSCWKPKRSAEADPWCPIKGQSCWKVKRAAEAFAEALRPTTGAIHAREAEISNAPGNAAFVAKRQVDELALVLAAASDDPEGFYNALGLADQFPADTEKRDAEPEPADHAADKRWCLIKGQSCWKAKRAAEAVVSAIEAVHDPRSVPFDPVARTKRAPEPWCLIKGQSCWKRDANAEAACNAPNGACTKAKRDLHAIYNVARSILEEQQ